MVETTGGTITDVVVVVVGSRVVVMGSVVAVGVGTVVVVRTMVVVVGIVVGVGVGVGDGMIGGLGGLVGIWAEIPGATAMMAAQTARSWIENFMTGFSFVLVEVFFNGGFFLDFGGGNVKLLPRFALFCS